ncbi:MAG: type II secretion system F family protein [Hyphomicrobiales bacterium]|nr:type II secretion system F family protein [Hyphomicrobiales bacterium]
MLQERGLDATGNYLYSLAFYNRLFLQSGMTGNPLVYLASFLIGGALAGIVVYLILNSTVFSLLTLLLIAVPMPFLVLLRMRARRIGRFATQLPEAIEVVVRSLKAGHPTPVALAMVGREMPDPIGTEFGIVSDEMSYGLEFVIAMRNLLERVGVDDLRLVVVSLSVQQTTGGNLAEILGNLSEVIRSRFRMRRRIRAISAEGRMSALLLSIFPFLTFGALNLVGPGFYGEVWNDPIVVPILVTALLWMALGDYIMYRMVNFDF